MEVVNRAHVDAQFPLPTGGNQLSRLHGGISIPMTTFLETTFMLGRSKKMCVSTHLRSNGGVFGIATFGVGHES